MLPLLLFVLAVSDAWANLPTRTTVAIDGNMADWNAVLVNPVNGHTDPQGSTPPSTDRDAPVSAARDLLAYAYTWDDTNLYGYAQRVASSFGFDRFVLYIDLDNDALMEGSDRVLQVLWSPWFVLGSLHAYQPVAGLGDAMVDGFGWADGYTLPGTLGGNLGWYWGSQAGNAVEVEFYVPWAALGVAAGAAVGLHMSAGVNGGVPTNIQDNMGATGGGALTTRFQEATIAPPLVSSQPGGNTVVYAHQLQNTGNRATIAEMSHAWGCAGAPTVAYWEDINANQSVDVGIDIQLIDTNADTYVDRALAVGESVALLIEVLLPGGVPGASSCDLTVTTWPRGQAACFTTVVDTNIYPDVTVTLVKGADRGSAAPGQVITYTTTYTNTGVDSAFAVVVRDAIPTNTTYVAGSATGVGVLLNYSHDFGSNWDTSEVPPVTDVRWSVLAPLAAGENGMVSLQVTVD